MMNFNELNLPLEVNPKTVTLSMDTMNLGSIKSKLFNIDNLSDRDLYDTIYDSYKYILDEMCLAKDVKLIQFLYSNARFIMTLTSVLSRIELDYFQTTYCNKLAYDYFTARGDKDKYIKALLLNLVKTVNRHKLPSLIGLGLSEEIACYLVNARYSSTKPDIQVRRLNLEMMKCSAEVMTTQMIVDIYGKLFDRITPLFENTMYDYYDQFVTKDMEDVYATINIAILEIVNNLPDDTMFQLLKNFKESYDLVNNGRKVRFNIYSFSGYDYPRLYNTLEMLKWYGIELPMS